MATVTNAWTNDKPEGSEAANTTDDRLRQWRVDVEERLKPFLYGFDATDNVAPNNEAGIKNLPFFEESSDPSKVTNYAHLYTTDVVDRPELFYQDDTSTTFQLTTGGALNVLSADLLGKLANNTFFTAVDNAGTGTTDLIKAGQNVAADTDVAILPDLTRMVTNAAPVEDTDLANKKYVDDQNAAQVMGSSTTDDADAAALTSGVEYTAVGDGILMVYTEVTNVIMTVKVDSVIVIQTRNTAGSPLLNATVPVPSGSTFEITASVGVVATWQPLGVLSAPTK
jgi:hypothetical protein